MPAVEATVTPANNRLANLVSPVPLQGGWQEGSLLYFKQQNPKGVRKPVPWWPTSRLPSTPGRAKRRR